MTTPRGPDKMDVFVEADPGADAVYLVLTPGQARVLARMLRDGAAHADPGRTDDFHPDGSRETP